MRAAHAVFMTLTVLILASAVPLVQAHAFPAPFAKAAAENPARATKPGRHSAGPRPSRWCGWWMRTQFGGGSEYNLARNWAKRGRPLNGPRVGAVVVWAHHVGYITGRTASGQWIVKSGNDGGRVRERPRSVAGAVFRKI
jgi:hypothetical protein